MNCIDSTFFCHNGKSSSQIDNILTKNVNKITIVKVQDLCDCNTSSHVHLAFVYKLETALTHGSKHKTSTQSILLWDKINQDIYLDVLGSELTKKSPLISVQLRTV